MRRQREGRYFNKSKELCSGVNIDKLKIAYIKFKQPFTLYLGNKRQISTNDCKLNKQVIISTAGESINIRL